MPFVVIDPGWPSLLPLLLVSVLALSFPNLALPPPPPNHEAEDDDDDDEADDDEWLLPEPPAPPVTPVTPPPAVRISTTSSQVCARFK